LPVAKVRGQKNRVQATGYRVKNTGSRGQGTRQRSTCPENLILAPFFCSTLIIV